MRLKIKNLTKKYDKRSTKGVHDISFEIDGGRLFIMGPSGSGKSTLLKLIAGELPADSGDIITKEDEKIALFDYSSLDSIETPVMDYLKTNLGKEASDEEQENLIRSNLAFFELTNEIEKNVCTLSTGQKQRLNLVKLFNLNPTIILFDEPFSHLDFNLKNELMLQINNYLDSKDIISLWVTHDIPFVLNHANRSILLNHGVLQSDGDIKDLYLTPPNFFTADFWPYNNIMTAKIMAFNHNSYTAEFSAHTIELRKIHQTFIDQDIALVIRPEQIIINQNGVYTAKFENSQFAGDKWIHTFSFLGQKYYTYGPQKLSNDFSFNIDPNIHWLSEV